MTQLTANEMSVLANSIMLSGEQDIQGKDVSRTFSRNKRPHAASLHAKLMECLNKEKTNFEDKEVNLSDEEKRLGLECVESRDWSIGDGNIADELSAKLVVEKKK